MGSGEDALFLYRICSPTIRKVYFLALRVAMVSNKSLALTDLILDLLN